MLRSFLLASSILLSASWPQAATLYWDGGTTDIPDNGNGLSGGTAGTWDTSIKNWDAGAVPYVAWTNGNLDTAVFGGTAGAVALASNIDVGGLRFNTTAYPITTTGFSLNFADTDNTILLNSIAAATITGPVGGSGNVILDSSNKGTAGTLTFGTGTGITVLSNGGRLSVTLYGAAVVKYLGSNTFCLIGALE